MSTEYLFYLFIRVFKVINTTITSGTSIKNVFQLVSNNSGNLVETSHSSLNFEFEFFHIEINFI